MADLKEEEQLYKLLINTKKRHSTSVKKNKVKQVFSVNPSDIFKGYNKDFLLPEQLFQEKNLN